jgi:hypothetical protein
MPEFLAFVEAGASFTVPDVLFRKIEEAEVKAFEQRFGGA